MRAYFRVSSGQLIPSAQAQAVCSDLQATARGSRKWVAFPQGLRVSWSHPVLFVPIGCLKTSLLFELCDSGETPTNAVQ